MVFITPQESGFGNNAFFTASSLNTSLSGRGRKSSMGSAKEIASAISFGALVYFIFFHTVIFLQLFQNKNIVFQFQSYVYGQIK